MGPHWGPSPGWSFTFMTHQRGTGSRGRHPPVLRFLVVALLVGVKCYFFVV